MKWGRQRAAQKLALPISCHRWAAVAVCSPKAAWWGTVINCNEYDEHRAGQNTELRTWTPQLGATPGAVATAVLDFPVPVTTRSSSKNLFLGLMGSATNVPCLRLCCRANAMQGPLSKKPEQDSFWKSPGKNLSFFKREFLTWLPDAHAAHLQFSSHNI